MPENYILDPVTGKPVPEPDLLAFARWYATADRRLALTKVAGHTVSTVFLGLDYQFGAGPPLLWETAVHDGNSWGVVAQYANRSEALAGHERYVQQVREVLASRTVSPPP